MKRQTAFAAGEGRRKYWERLKIMDLSRELHIEVVYPIKGGFLCPALKSISYHRPVSEALKIIGCLSPVESENLPDRFSLNLFLMNK